MDMNMSSKRVGLHNAFLHRCIACAGMFGLALACVSIPTERRRGKQWGAPVNAPLAQTSPAPSRPPSVWHTCFPAWRAAHLPLPSVSSLIPHLAHFQHASSLFLPPSLSFPPVYLTHAPALLFPFVSVAFFIASVAYPGCPLLHPLSSPRPSVACLFNLIWYLDCASVHSANTLGQSACTAHNDSLSRWHTLNDKHINACI